ncbi:MAG: hypothetical protein GPOALKHO_001586 [Sodalis sp.]|nr:MAG: hypothetical protein GPOALKHO_001586 [Sodalis sp.]
MRLQPLQQHASSFHRSLAQYDDCPARKQTHCRRPPCQRPWRIFTLLAPQFLTSAEGLAVAIQAFKLTKIIQMMITMAAHRSTAGCAEHREHLLGEVIRSPTVAEKADTDNGLYTVSRWDAIQAAINPKPAARQIRRPVFAYVNPARGVAIQDSLTKCARPRVDRQHHQPQDTVVIPSPPASPQPLATN